ncbi:MAG: PilZ domain-containing protein [Gammaproteobacteria bacterium]|nr:PilZ domain-containing protein [Gammaproteobacteria bacterium]
MASVMGNVEERRSHERKNLPVNSVLVYYRGMRVHRCAASDVSLRGVFLRSPSFPVNIGAKLSLVFVFQQGNVIQTYRKNAIIVRMSREGVGVSFLSSGNRTNRNKDSMRET